MVQTTCDVLFFKSKLQIEYIPYLATEWSRRQIKIINWLPFRILILCYFSQVAKNFLVSTFLVNHIFPSKYMFTCCYPAGKYWSPESPEEVPSNVPRTSFLTIQGTLPSDLLRKSRSDVPGTSRINLTGTYLGRRSKAFSVPSEDVLRTW